MGATKDHQEAAQAEKWRAEEDLRTLRQADEISGDTDRLNRAKRLAKEEQEALAKIEEMEKDQVRDAVRAHGYHTVGDLIEMLKKHPDELVVLLSIDPEGNNHNPADITDVGLGTYGDNEYRSNEDRDEEDGGDGIAFDNDGGELPCLVLYPQ